MLMYHLTERELPAFADLIPDTLQKLFLEGELEGIFWFDEDFEAPAAVAICREVHDWMELVWFAVAAEYRGLSLSGFFLQEMTLWVEMHGNVWGIFADLPEGEYAETLETVFRRIGFAVEEAELSLYELEVGDLEQSQLLQAASTEKDMIALGMADEKLKRMVQTQLDKEKRKIPIESPVRWEDYDPELSVICAGEYEVKGMALVSSSNHAVNLNLLWSGSSAAAFGILVHIAKNAYRRFGKEKKIWIPAVTDISRRLVENLVPQAKRVRTRQASLRFEKPYLETPVLFEKGEE